MAETVNNDKEKQIAPRFIIVKFIAALVIFLTLSLTIMQTTSQAEDSAFVANNSVLSREADQHLRAIDDRTVELVAGIIGLPKAVKTAVLTLFADQQTMPLGLVARLFFILFVGWLTEQLFWLWAAAWITRIINSHLATAQQRFAAQVQRFLFAQSFVLSFATGGCFAYLFAAPPGVAGVMALDAVLAIVAVRTVSAFGRFLFAPGGPRLRLVALPTRTAWRAQYGLSAIATVSAIGLLLSALLRLGSATMGVADAIVSITLFFVALLIPAVVTLVVVTLPRPKRRSPHPVTVALDFVPMASWLLAQAGLTFPAWAMLVTGLAPALSLALADVVRTIVFGPNRSGTLTREERIVSRATRNIALIAALLLITRGPPGSKEGVGLSVTAEIISALLILLGTDLAWQVARTLIDRGLKNTRSEARADRLATILPAVRTVVLLALAVTAALSIASAFGLQIGPLLAGAGVLGLTIGFGAQTLVRDVIAGFFLLLDDAFRIGETIESGTLQGQVEAFSLRSVRLRDDNGHVHTVAFGELKVVTNFSRDWAGLEIPVYMPHGVSFEAAAEVLNSAILALEADTTFSALLQGSTRFLGATALSEASVRFAVTIRTLPGSQAKVRSALLHYVLLRAAASNVPLGASLPAIT